MSHPLLTPQLSSRVAIQPTKKDENSKSTYAVAIVAIENEKNRAKKIREGLTGGGGGSCVPCFEWHQFEQWMRATCEGAELLRGNNEDDSDTDAGSESDS